MQNEIQSLRQRLTKMTEQLAVSDQAQRDLADASTPYAEVVNWIQVPVNFR